MNNNILILENSGKFSFGGGQRVTLETMKALYGEALLHLADTSGASEFKMRARAYAHGMQGLVSVDSKRLADRSSFSFGPLELFSFPLLIPVNVLRVLLYMKRRGLKKRNTIIYAPVKKTLIYAWLLHIITGCPFVYHAHTLDDTNSIFFKLLRPALQAAAAVLCVSEAVQERLRLPNSRIIANPLPFAPTEVPKKHPEALNVAVFASLIPLKGIEYFLKSRELLEHPEKVRYLVFGRGPLEEELRHSAPEGVEFRGFCDDVQKTLSKEVHVSILPSVVPESFGMVLIEAMACGVPVITTSIGGQAELVEDGVTGFLVPPRDGRAIARAVDALVQDNGMYERMSQAALDASQAFSGRHFAEAVRDIFAHIRNTA